MYVTRYANPYRDMRRGFDLMNTLLNSMETAPEEGVMNDFVPSVNTREDEKSYVIELDLPGIRKEDIEITTEDNVLTISGERKHKEEIKQEDYYLLESRFGLISRTFVLPDGIETNKIDASYEDGRLRIALEKEESRKAKSIAVK